MGFVHLHAHSQFSILDGTIKPSRLATLAVENGMPAVAQTDVVNLFGAVTFYKACKAAGVKPILGAELHVQPEGRSFEDPYREEGGFQIIALVENEKGYLNLCELITRAIYDGVQYKPRIDFNDLALHSEGLIVLTGGRKGVFRDWHHEERKDSNVMDWFKGLTNIFSNEYLFLEMQDLGLDGQDLANQRIRELSKEAGYLTVVTNGVHYELPEDAAIHEVLTSISQSASLDNEARIRSNTDQAWFKSEADIRLLFPDDGEAIERTVLIAERCEYHFNFDTYHFPATTPPDTNPNDSEHPDTAANWEYFYRAFPPPDDFGYTPPDIGIPPHPKGAGSLKGYFDWYSREGLKVRLEGIPEEHHAEYHARLDEEIGIINSMGFPAYMLIVAEFINWSKDNDIPVGPGRGSAAGSLVAFAMRITDIDPIVYGLLFERFLNPERVSMPDIDVDFCQDRREEAIEHVRQKYGSEYVSQIITYGTLKAKAALKDVARVLKMGFTDSDRLSKMVPDELGITLNEALEKSAPLAAVRDGDPKIRRVIEISRRIEGMCRQTGVHAAGVVIADKPLVNYAPLYRVDPAGGPVVQYDMKSAESIGLIKFDFLGLKTLDQIRDALILIEANRGVKVDMAHLPLEDPKTYEMLSGGDSLGVFQLESSGMRELLTRLRPNCMEDMVALVALYRPGPLQSGMTDDFVERKHGRTEVVYPLPVLEPILKETYGTIVYQEQVMMIAQVMSSYSLGEADLLRRAMGKKKKEEMDKQKARFVSGADGNGYDPKRAEEIFDLMATFAAYGFNKSHSAAYGYISFQTAYLKANYRAEYMAALLTVESSNTEKVLAYINDCRQHGIEILPACVNASIAGFSVPSGEMRQIRYGLAAIKNVGVSAVEAIVEAREKCGGTFSSVLELFEKVDYKRVNKRVFEHLIKAGALDFAGINRTSLLSGLAGVCSAGVKHQNDAASGQGSLFGMMGGGSSPLRFRFPTAEPQGHFDMLMAEKDVLGLFLTGHPMEGYVADVARFAKVPVSELRRVESDQEVRLVGLPTNVQSIRTRRGDKMAFIQLEDERAGVEVVFFSKTWVTSQKVISAGLPILVVGTVEHAEEGTKIRAKSVELLSEVRARMSREAVIKMSAAQISDETIHALRTVVDKYPGTCPMRFVVDMSQELQVEMIVHDVAVDPGSNVRAAIGRIFSDIGALEYR